jgi:hypothetical protein
MAQVSSNAASDGGGDKWAIFDVRAVVWVGSHKAWLFVALML